MLTNPPVLRIAFVSSSNISTLAILLNMSSLELTMLTLPPVTLTLTGSSTLSPPAVSSSPLSSGSLILFTQPMSVYSLTVNFRAFCR